MPEVVEVHYTTAMLKKYIGWTCNHRGQMLRDITCHGKHMLWIFDDYAIQQHLGMTGHWSFFEREREKLVRSLVFVSTEGKEETIYYYMPRPIGYKWVEGSIEDGKKWLHDQAEDLLPLALANAEMPSWFEKLLRQKSNTMIRNFLYDQHCCSGIGNYLRTDIMYVAKVHPNRKIAVLLEKNLAEQIWKAITQCIQESYQAGGYTIKDFKRPNGEEGKYKPHIYKCRGADRLAIGRCNIYWDSKVQIN